MEIEETSLKTKRKKNACPFCDPITLFNCSNYWRHLIRKHPDNIEVMRFKSLPKGSSERREILAEIRNKGNFLYNSAKSSLFVPSRRPLKEQSPKKNHYVTCIHCLVLVKRKNFFLHRKICSKFENNLVECEFCKEKIAEGRLKNHLKNKCPKRDTFTIVPGKKSNKSKPQRRVLCNSSLFVNKDLVGASEDLATNVLPLLRIDEISEIIKEDPLILTVGSKLRSNHKENHSRHDIISKMRPLGQLVQSMRKMNIKIQTLKDCLRSKHVNLLFKAVQQMSGYNESSGIVQIPSMPSRIKGPLSVALQIVKNDVRCDPNLSYDTKKELLFDFQTTEDIIKTDWKFVISTNAQKSLNENHRNKGILMPLEDDIKVASQYLTEKEELILKQLNGNADPVMYDNLCQAIIADIIIFNCRRAGEVARAGVKHYLERNQIEFEGDLKSVLSEEELKAKDSLTMFYIPGKRDRTVPILLTDIMKRCVDLIVAMRTEMGVNNNPLLFPRLYSDKPYDSCKIIRDLRNSLPLKRPQHFTSTGLRHEIATRSHLQDADKPGYRKILFSHMGHTEAIHNEKYVTPLPVLQLSKVGSSLLQRSGKATTEHNPETQNNKECKKNKPGKATTEQNPETLNNKECKKNKPGKATTEQNPETLNNKECKKNKPKKKRKFSHDDVGEDFDDPNFVPNASSSLSSGDEIENVPTKKIKPHNPWSLEQQECVVQSFKDFFKNKEAPGKKLCENLISCNDCLKDRSWQQVKAFVENVNKNRRKLLPQLKLLVQ